MADFRDRYEVPPISTDFSWEDRDILGDIINGMFFGFPVAPVSSIYIGAAGQAQKYLGARLETELYVGSGNLWP
jgi:hypothetical protein